MTNKEFLEWCEGFYAHQRSLVWGVSGISFALGVCLGWLL